MAHMATRATLAVLCLLPLAGCGGDEAEKRAPAAVTVSAADFKFGPATATVSAGGTVTFTNRDKAPHTAESERFDTGRLDRGQSKRIEFDKPGTYEYFCDFHRFMTATVE